MLDDPNKLIQNFFEGPNDSNVNWQELAELFAKDIGYMAKENLPEKEKITPLDMLLFNLGIRGVRENCEGLVGVLDRAKSNPTSEAYKYLHHLMAAIFVLGHSGCMSPRMKKVWTSESQAEKGKIAARISARG